MLNISSYVWRAVSPRSVSNLPIARIQISCSARIWIQKWSQSHIYTVPCLEFFTTLEFFTLRSCIQTNLVKKAITLVISLLSLSQSLPLEKILSIRCSPPLWSQKKGQHINLQIDWSVLLARNRPCRYWHFNKAGPGLCSASVLQVKTLLSPLALFNGKIQNGLCFFLHSVKIWVGQ